MRALLVLNLVIVGDSVCAQSGQKGIVPKAGFVPDATTARNIAEAVLVPVYGKQAVAAERPFKATLKNDIWIITGSIPCEAAPKGASCPGGAAEVHISRKDGRVTFMTHSQ
jgi:hypothetical protein